MPRGTEGCRIEPDHLVQPRLDDVIADRLRASDILGIDRTDHADRTVAVSGKVIGEAFDQLLRGGEADAKLALPGIAGAAKALAQREIADRTKGVASPGPGAFDAVGACKIDSKVTNTSVTGMPGRRRARDDGHIESARQKTFGYD